MITDSPLPILPHSVTAIVVVSCVVLLLITLIRVLPGETATDPERMLKVISHTETVLLRVACVILLAIVLVRLIWASMN